MSAPIDRNDLMPPSASPSVATPTLNEFGYVETDADRRIALRRDWRIAALKQWLRGPRLFALVVAMASVPTITYYIQHADGKTGWLDYIFSSFSLTIIGPVITVIFTLLALDGPRGIARVDDLRTIEGGPAEWVRALIFSARVCVLAVIAVWADRKSVV